MKTYRKLLTALFLSVVCALACFGLTACDMGGNGETNEPEHRHEFIEVASKEFLAEEATCYNKAIYYKSCECGERSGETFEYGDYAHFFGGWFDEVPANCYADENGTVGHYTCEKCNGWFDKNGNKISDLTIQPTHEYKWVDSTPPQENQHGYKGHNYCSNCRRLFNENKEEIGDTNITIHCYDEDDWVEEVPAKCEKTGTKGHYYCSVCKGYFDKDGKFISWYLSSLTIKAKGHEYENGYCKHCGNRTPSTGLEYGCQKNGYGNVSYFYVTGIGTCTDTEVVIPSTLTAEDGYEYPVQEISHNAFNGCTNLTSITIPASVTVVRNDAFYNCTNLTKVNYTGTVNDWASISFQKGTYSTTTNPLYYANNLYINNELVTQATITVSQINSYAFYGCYSLSSVTLESSVQTIGSYAFSRCFKLAEVINKTGKNIDDTWRSDSYVDNYALNVKTEGETDIKNVNDFLFLTKDDTNYLVNYVGNEKSLTLPENFNGNNYDINSFALAYCRPLTSVTLGSGATKIGDSAFYGCKNLATVTIGGSVTSIGKYAFRGCSNLTSLKIGDNVETIGDYAFCECSNLLGAITFKGVKSIGENAFKGCYNLASVTLGENVESIGKNAFSECKKLVEVINFSKTITIYAYGSNENGCIAQNAISVTTNGSSAITTTADGFVYLTVGASFGYSATVHLVNYIGNKTELTIPENITAIGNYVFEGRDNLTSVTIPDEVTAIGKYAFSECSNLKNINIPTSATYIGKYAFNECHSLINIVIPDNVEKIGEYAFNNCYNLTSVTIGHGITGDTSFGSYSFYGCKKLVEIMNRTKTSLNLTGSADVGFVADYALYIKTSWDATDSKIQNENGFLFLTVDGTKYLVNYIGNEANITLPSGDYKINRYAFYGCNSLKSITIPDGFTSIDDYAFYGCSTLESVTIPNSVTSIGNYAFRDCFGLTSVTIPDSVTSIGDCAFNVCKSLTSVIIPDNVTSIGDYAFSSCYNLESVTIGNSVTSIGYSAFLNCNNLKNITIPDSITSIGNSAFGSCSNLKYNEYGNASYLGNSSNPYVVLIKATSTSITECTINENCKIIYDSAFEYCSKLTSITIPDSVTSIGKTAFSYCSSLTSITIPDSVTYIGQSAFYGCDNLEYNEYNNAYYIGNSNNHYVVLMKAKSTDITSCTINEKCKFIYDNAFRGCENLTSITIPNSVISIGYGAFRWCNHLENVYYNGTQKEWNEIRIYTDYNNYLIAATKYFYSETKPTTGGNYWHYVNGVPTAW